MADSPSFVIASPEQTSLTASQPPEKEINWSLSLICGINELKSVALIKLYAREVGTSYILRYISVGYKNVRKQNNAGFQPFTHTRPCRQ